MRLQIVNNIIPLCRFFIYQEIFLCKENYTLLNSWGKYLGAFLALFFETTMLLVLDCRLDVAVAQEFLGVNGVYLLKEYYSSLTVMKERRNTELSKALKTNSNLDYFIQ